MEPLAEQWTRRKPVDHTVEVWRGQVWVAGKNQQEQEQETFFGRWQLEESEDMTEPEWREMIKDLKTDCRVASDTFTYEVLHTVRATCRYLSGDVCVHVFGGGEFDLWSFVGEAALVICTGVWETLLSAGYSVWKDWVLYCFYFLSMVFFF